MSVIMPAISGALLSFILLIIALISSIVGVVSRVVDVGALGNLFDDGRVYLCVSAACTVNDFTPISNFLP